MELEIKHLTNYLPYKLQFLMASEHESNDPNIDELKSIDIGLKMVNFGWGNAKTLTEIKPLLRSLSNLSNVINVNGEDFIPVNELNLLIDEFGNAKPTIVIIDGFGGFYFEWYARSKNAARRSVPFNFYEKLFEWHFDVFSLIKNGLATELL